MARTRNREVVRWKYGDGNMENMGTDGKFSHVSLRTNQKLQETFRLSPSFEIEKAWKI
jgi:hypothetical protein